MNTTTASSTCGGHACSCGQPLHATPQTPQPVARVNGVALNTADEPVDVHTLEERACAEVLRQHAVAQGLLPPHPGDQAPELDAAQRQIVEAMLEREVVTPVPTEAECLRYYEAHKARYVQGQSLHVRHILFAVTPGVNVHALTLRAEAALLELLRKEVPPNRFEQLATELSNCPSSLQGGDLGWLTPEDCAPELANELFFQRNSSWGLGLHPRLVHTRFGLHIVEVQQRKKGKQSPFEAVREQIKTRLTLQTRATALRQYMRLLVGQAQLEGVVLEGADTPLVQ